MQDLADNKTKRLSFLGVDDEEFQDLEETLSLEQQYRENGVSRVDFTWYGYNKD